MDVIVTSLEALIQRATSPQNPGPDKAAVDAFCGMVNKEPGYTHVAARLITTKIQSSQEWEALQGLSVLEACMNKCGPGFHSEVGKFRFLNEMIKLVSPKYLGDQTPPAVRQRVLHLMFSWTIEYPHETKIKEAYQMLRKQGVVKDEVPIDTTTGSGDASETQRTKTSVFEDERKSRLLQKLLQSKNPDDIQAANRLIKTMVKEDERRVEIRSRRATELEVAHNNAQLLNEMLNCYTPGSSSSEDLALIKELRESCERCKSQLIKDLRPQDCLYGESTEVVEKLNSVLAIYEDVVVGGNIRKNVPSELNSTPATLLDLSSPQQDMLGESESAHSTGISSKKSDLDALSDIFGCNVGEAPQESAPAMQTLEPTSLLTNADNASASATSEKTGAARALDDLNALGESLLKQSLSQGNSSAQTSRSSGKIPMNQIGRAASLQQTSPLNVLKDIQKKEESTSNPLDLDFLSNSLIPTSPLAAPSTASSAAPSAAPSALPSAAPSATTPLAARQDSKVDDLLNGDDAMVDLSMDEPQSPTSTTKSPTTTPKSPVKSVPSPPATTSTEIKSLADISISMDNLKPASVPPCTALDDNGMSIVIHLAEGVPRPDVTVYVVTTISKQTHPLSNYGFQAVVPKGCKLRLLPPSGLELPPHNPFLPPAAITQVMLIANPAKVPLNLKFILSYTMDDETVTEMGSVEALPTLS